MTISDLPDEIRADLAARAEAAGQSLQEYLRGYLALLAGARPGEQLRRVIQQRVRQLDERVPREEHIAEFLRAGERPSTEQLVQRMRARVREPGGSAPMSEILASLEEGRSAR